LLYSHDSDDCFLHFGNGCSALDGVIRLWEVQPRG